MPLLVRAAEGRRMQMSLLTRRTTSLSGLLALLGSLAGCGGTDPRIPASVNLSTNSVAFTSLGQTHQLSPSIADEDGKPILDAPVIWTSSNDQVASVNQDGLVTAEGPGSATITATADAATATAQVSVIQTPTEIVKVSGDGQTALAGQALPSPLVVQVNDAGGSAIAGATVTFAVTEGDGSIGTATVTTGSSGTAATSFTTGTIAGSTQTIVATIATTALSVSFAAVAAPDPTSFNIGVRFLSPATPAQRQAFTDARLRWESAVTDDLPDGFLDAPAGTCGTSSPAVLQDIDDVVILVNLVAIDGPGGVLGGAGPCWIRDVGDLTILGAMQFDTDDLEMLEADGFLSNVILHEMGHVLGIGTLWGIQGLLADPSLPPNSGSDPHFTGSQGVAAFDDIGGATYVAGAKVPVENSGGQGTADSHWRESVFGNELMTGFIGAGQSPLSIVTLASLADQGYGVNFGAADSYNLLLALRAFGEQPKLRLEEEVMRGPIRRVDPRGRVTGLLDR